MNTLSKVMPEDDPPKASAPPQVFVRTFGVPAGAPWVQSRAALLEARHGAPLPLTDLMHRLKRLESWRPSHPSRFAAFYIRRTDYRGPFETVVNVDGTSISVAFGGKKPSLTALRPALFAGLCAAVVLALVGLTVSMTLSARQEADMRQAQQQQAQNAVSVAIDRARGQALRPAGVIEDLDWLARSRVADAQILAIHWDHGLLAIESRGEAPPLTASDRQLVRSPRHLRPGIWLWGMRPLAVSLRDAEP
jgi:hypothetical protein